MGEKYRNKLRKFLGLEVQKQNQKTNDGLCLFKKKSLKVKVIFCDVVGCSIWVYRFRKIY